MIQGYVSVIIPAFQAEMYLEAAVESAFSQKGVLEVILVEDGSTDNTLNVCEMLCRRYTDLVKYYRHPQGGNLGVSASRNLGINKAKGKYIAFLDADDYYLDDRFIHDLEILESDNTIDGVYNALGVDIYEESERERVNYNLTTVSYPIPPEKLFEEMMPIGRAGYFAGDALTVRRAAFDIVGLFDTALKISEDTHMWLRMAAKLRLVSGLIDRPVAMRGVHCRNSVKEISLLNYYRPLMYSSLLNWAEKNNLPEHRKMAIWRRLYKAAFYYIDCTQIGFFQNKIKKILFITKHVIRRPYIIVK